MFSIIFGCLARNEEDLEKAKESYRLFCRVLGKKDKNTIDVLCNIGTIYAWIEMNNEAMTNYKECYSISCNVLGKDHPDTIMLKEYIDSIYIH